MLALMGSLLTWNSAHAALALDATRYIYKGNEQFISVTANNESKSEYGAQVWVDNIVEKDTRPTFIATPSFFRIKEEGRQVFRILKVSDHMSKEKESVYWLNLQEIPQAREGSGISMAIRTQVKLIYRPTAIVEGRDGAEANMTIEYQPGSQWLVNSTPYIFAIGAVHDSEGKGIEFTPEERDNLTLFMPGDRVEVTGHTVESVNALSDYGNLEEFELKQMKKK
ncbi:fimbria/pilus periplasmic chaperone [Vibrio panuliri]|uniref:Clp protease ClpE n=2 Tax=Vibrio panuliri TaxID=1381081 RepID=A0ABX3F8I1_9VIBR|nr:fimbria/pilus periplasmic chaperone [Vibrio panuliri]OLQ84746.1 Clp protease ClpE [Vibrio panuliri]